MGKVLEDCFSFIPAFVVSVLFGLLSIWDTQDNKWSSERLPLVSLIDHYVSLWNCMNAEENKAADIKDKALYKQEAPPGCKM